jgi:hypothetical protein
MEGSRAGWPLTVDGIASQPVAGPDGSLAIVRMTKPGLESRVLWFAPGGGAPLAASGGLPLDPMDDRTGAGAVLLSPIIGADGTTWVAGTVDSSKPAVAHLVLGSPAVNLYLRGLPLQHQGTCPPEDSGCGVWRALPAIRSDGTLILPENPTGDDGGLASSGGGSLVALAPNGRIRAGWPVSLPDTMAGYWSVIAAPDNRVRALDVIPTDAGNQWSFVILGQDGAVLATTPIIRP